MISGSFLFFLPLSFFSFSFGFRDVRVGGQMQIGPCADKQKQEGQCICLGGGVYLSCPVGRLLLIDGLTVVGRGERVVVRRALWARISDIDERARGARLDDPNSTRIRAVALRCRCTPHLFKLPFSPIRIPMTACASLSSDIHTYHYHDQTKRTIVSSITVSEMPPSPALV
ncbi:hypothetical protein BDZ94DRAFT_1067758 [Collybia nuda]|uniref:Secreted protein n=1 Tax=Collybia nuda TaxID=64659 RepID=A0A9P5XY67_9AGAR|nr:hypothetical protein BDZ94DRAFT_1067758 [Collybia nuda]